MISNPEAGQFTKQDIDAAVSSNFIPIKSSPMGRYISNISFGDYYNDLDSFRLVREGTDKFGTTSYNVILKLKSGKEYTLKERYDEQGQSSVQRPKSGKLEFRLDERPFSESKGLYSASGYVLEADRAADVKFKTENPRATSDYTEWDSRWGTRWYNFRNPAVGRGDYTLEGDIPFSGRMPFGMNSNQLFVNGFPVDEEGRRITPGGSDASYGAIGVSIGTTPLNYNDPNKTPLQTPLVDVVSGVPNTGQGLPAATPSRTYTAKDGLEFTDQMAFATYQTGLMTEARAKTEAERLAAEAEAKAAQEKFEKEFKAENAAISLTALFEKYGLGTLAPKVKELAIAGYSDDTITIQLSETPEYKQRFRANEDRRKKGLAVLSPSEYIGLEDRYRQILKSYGLKQFDNDEYVTQFLSNNISPTELTSRVETAVNRVQNADPLILDTLRSYYNIPEINLVAYMLDPEKEEPALLRQVQAAEIGAAARVQGLTAGRPVAEQLAAQGITQAQAQKGYSTIAGLLPEATKLSQIYGDVLDQYGQAEAEQEVFNSLASAQRKRRSLTEREIAAFSGNSGLGRTSLTSQTGGTF